jgi:hypothetical protein
MLRGVGLAPQNAKKRMKDRLWIVLVLALIAGLLAGWWGKGRWAEHAARSAVACGSNTRAPVRRWLCANQRKTLSGTCVPAGDTQARKSPQKPGKSPAKARQNGCTNGGKPLAYRCKSGGPAAGKPVQTRRTRLWKS